MQHSGNTKFLGEGLRIAENLDPSCECIWTNDSQINIGSKLLKDLFKISLTIEKIYQK